MKSTFLILITLFAFMGALISQDVPRVISYQGVLVNESGKPEDGSVDILFGLQNLEGAEHIDWIEERKGIQIRGGIFHVFLGDSSVPAGFPVLRGNYALSIKVNGKIPPYFVPLSSVPYALHALVADSLINVIDSVKASFKAEMAKFADSSRVSYISDTTKMRIPSGVPIGTIVAYGGNTVPNDWLPCDGRELNAAQNQEYKPLFEAIGVAWGGNSSLNVFRLPDLQGVFLRGVDQSGKKDSDNQGRISIHPGGNIGNKVGSYQEDAIQNHRHFTFNITALGNNGQGIGAFPGNENMFSSFIGDYEIPGPGRFATIIKTSADNPIEPTVGPTSFQTQSSKSSSETRPKNVYVNYIIKAR